MPTFEILTQKDGGQASSPLNKRFLRNDFPVHRNKNYFFYSCTGSQTISKWTALAIHIDTNTHFFEWTVFQWGHAGGYEMQGKGKVNMLWSHG